MNNAIDIKTAASELGKLGRNVPKRYSPEELERRTRRIKREQRKRAQQQRLAKQLNQ